MTLTELKALVLASGLSHSEFARRIGMTPRNFFRILSGKQAIGPRLAGDILRLFGAADRADREWPRDEWIVGEGPPPARREYVIHTAAPRFVARVVAIDELTDRPEPDEEPMAPGGVEYQAGPDSLICEIDWIDPAPAEPNALARLMDRAADQLDWDS